MKKLKERIMELNLKKAGVLYTIALSIFILISGIVSYVNFSDRAYFMFQHFKTTVLNYNKDKGLFMNGNLDLEHFFIDLNLTGMDVTILSCIVLGLTTFAVIYFILMFIMAAKKVFKFGADEIVFGGLALLTNKCTCSNCGKIIGKNSTYCTQCGTSVLNKCTVCEEVMKSNDKFCKRCGHVAG